MLSSQNNRFRDFSLEAEGRGLDAKWLIDSLNFQVKDEIFILTEKNIS